MFTRKKLALKRNGTTVSTGRTQKRHWGRKPNLGTRTGTPSKEKPKKKGQTQKRWKDPA